MTNFLLKKAGLAFDEGKTRVALKKATLALLMVIEAKTTSAKAKRKKVAAGLQGGMSYQTSMDVEQLIRQDFEVQAYDAIKVHCNQLADRLRVLGLEKECPPGTKEAVCTLIWAAGKAEVPEELQVVKVQLTKKYGKDFATKALNNDNSCINKLVAEKLLFQADPAPQLVEDYLETIEKETNASSTVQQVEAPATRAPVARGATPQARVPVARAPAPAATAPTKRAAVGTEPPPEESPMKNASKPLIKSPRMKTSSKTARKFPGQHPKETPEEETPKRTRSRESPEDETPKTAPTTTPSSSTSSPTAEKQTPPQFMKSVAAATANQGAPESEPPVTPESLKMLPVSIRRAANAAVGAVRPIIPA